MNALVTIRFSTKDGAADALYKMQKLNGHFVVDHKAVTTRKRLANERSKT